MYKYQVNFAYTICVEAEDEFGAEKKALVKWAEIMPTIDEMRVDVELE